MSSAENALIDRWLVAMDLWAAGIAIERQRLRRLHPEALPDEVETRLDHWLEERPGAQHGDGPAPQRHGPRRR